MPTTPTTTVAEQVAFADEALQRAERLAGHIGCYAVGDIIERLNLIVQGDGDANLILTRHQAAWLSNCAGVAAHLALARSMEQAGHVHPGVPAGPPSTQHGVQP